MTWNSVPFVLFALAFYPAWYGLRRQHSRLVLLCLGSFLFYGYFDWRYLLLLIGTGGVDFTAALMMRRYPEWRRSWLFGSLATNIGTLATFKYAGFVTETLNILSSQLGLEMLRLPVVHFDLPPGISFYTLMAMSYTIDVYRGELEPVESPVLFYAWLSMFPHLVAGPILRAAGLIPQMKMWTAPTPAQLWDGWCLICWGFFKKCVMADCLAPAVDAAFANAQADKGWMFWWLATIMATLQIYYDFSGYTDIARGLGKLLGYEFPLNFDAPLLSASVTEFWRRWHITFSRWIVDYVFTPLHFSLRDWGQRGAAAAVLATFFLSGLWHGAAWTFILWGLLHGSYLVVERLTRWPEALKRAFGPIGVALGVAITFVLVNIAFVLFRAQSLGDALHIYGSMLGMGEHADLGGIHFPMLTLALLHHLYLALRNKMPVLPGSELVEVVSPAVLLVLAIFFRGPGRTFIYFQF